MFVPVIYDNLEMNIDLRVDLLINDCIVVELKAVEIHFACPWSTIIDIHETVEKTRDLINFFPDNITKSMRPFVNEYFRNLPD